jgi:hypothetical protein
MRQKDTRHTSKGAKDEFQEEKTSTSFSIIR